MTDQPTPLERIQEAMQRLEDIMPVLGTPQYQRLVSTQDALLETGRWLLLVVEDHWCDNARFARDLADEYARQCAEVIG